MRSTLWPSSFLAVLLLLSSTAAAQSRCPSIREADLVEEWRYAPPEDGPAEQVIGQPGWVARGRSGNTFVLDLRGSRIVRLDARGRFQGAFGRTGRGPGEVLSAVTVRATPAGEVAVLDDGQSRVVFFSESGEHRRTVRLGVPIASARDLLVLADGEIVVSGVAVGSNAVVHRFSPDGAHRGSLGSQRMDLEEPILRERYSDGALAHLPDGSIAFAQRTPFRLQVYRNGRRTLDRTDPRVVPDYVAQVAQRAGAGWRFLWRHPRLTTVLPMDGGCYLVGVQVPPREPDAEPSSFRTTLFVLDAQGRVASEVRLSRFFWGTQLWSDPAGMRLLGFVMDRDTELLHPVQYRVRAAAAAPERARPARILRRGG